MDSDKYLKFLSYIFLTVLFFLFIYSVYDGRFYLSHFDEVNYYSGAKLFAESSSLKAPLCINEKRSILGEFCWYGPAYQIIYGSIEKLFGIHNLSFISFHFVLFIIILLYIIRYYPLSTSIRYILVLTLLLNSSITKYIYTYYPETVNILFGIILLSILLQIGKKKNYIYLYVSLILLFTLVRVTNIFWILGVIPYSRNVKGFLINLSLVLFSFLYAYLFMYYCMAPPVFKGLSTLISFHSPDNILLSFSKIFHSFLYNSIAVYKDSHFSLFILLFLYLVLIALLLNEIKLILIRHKELNWKFKSVFKEILEENKIKFSLSTVFIFTSSMFAFITFYDIRSFFLLKYTAFLFPILIISITFYDKRIIKIVIVALLILYPLSFSEVFSTIQDRKHTYDLVQEKTDLIKDFNSLKSYLPNREITILYDDINLGFPNNVKIDPSLFFYSTSQNSPVLYTTNNVDENIDSLRLKLHNRIKVDFIITRATINLDLVSLIKSGKYFNLYEINDRL